MTSVRIAALVLALPLLAGCIRSETVTGTIVYPPGTPAEAEDSYGTETARPGGAAAETAHRRPDDPYANAEQCAAAQEKLLRLDSYLITRPDLYAMEDAIAIWTGLAVELGAERGFERRQVLGEIDRLAARLPGREADRIAAGCIADT